MPVVMMSGHATLDTAVEATRIGAADFLEKPITLNKLLTTVQQVLQRPIVRSTTTATGNFVATTSAMTATAANTAAVRPVVATPVMSHAPVSVSAVQTNPPVSVGTEDVSRSGFLGSIPLDQPLRDARDEFERVYFEYHLQRENHSMTRVSEKTGLERTHLYRKLRQLGIDSRRRSS